MEQIEKVEKLVSTFGVSYEKAKEALEACDWDAVDAAIYLEREKKAGQTNGERSCNDEKQNAKGGCFNTPVEEMKDAGKNCFKTCWDLVSQNMLVIKNRNGELFLEIPVGLSIILICVFFWAVFFVAGILFVMGYTFSFSGPHLGNKRVKKTVKQVGNAAKDFANKVKDAVVSDNYEHIDEQSETAAEQTPEEEKKEQKSSEE